MSKPFFETVEGCEVRDLTGAAPSCFVWPVGGNADYTVVNRSKRLNYTKVEGDGINGEQHEQ